MATSAPQRNVPPAQREPSASLEVGSKISIRGTIISRGDIYLNGEVEGKVEAAESTVTVGPNAKLIADMEAKRVVVVGTVDGNIKASEVIELKKTGSITGDLTTSRVAIEDGAYFKGTINIQRT